MVRTVVFSRLVGAFFGAFFVGWPCIFSWFAPWFFHALLVLFLVFFSLVGRVFFGAFARGFFLILNPKP